MPLNARYSPFNIREVLKIALTPGPDQDIGFGARAPGYYKNTNALVLCPSTDKVDENVQKLMTIETAFEAIRDLPKEEKLKKIIIPVAEEQKILGLFPRNHWVTLQYDPKTNSAHLLDSRPWLMSFLYPTSSMKNLLMSGLEKVYDPKVIAKMSFDTHYQGVQDNDTHCGAWTTTNIRDLAGANVSGIMHFIEEQASAYSASDEQKVINYNINSVAHGALIVEKDVPKSLSTPGFFQRLFIFLGFIQSESPETKPIDSSSLPVNSSAYSGIKKSLENHNSIRPPVDNIGDNWDDSITNEQKPVQAPNLENIENKETTEPSMKAESSIKI